MGGAKKLLNAAALEDRSSYEYEKSSKAGEIISEDKTNSKDDKTPTNTTKVKKAAASEKSASNRAKKQKKVGRPTKASKGEKTRKQYTLTLEEEDYARFMEEAKKHRWSFASFMEEAAKEYIENHR